MEIQNVNQHNIEKRARYYQSLIDSRMLEKGMDYDELNDTYIIFVCTFDYFKLGLAKYNITRYIEDTSTDLAERVRSRLDSVRTDSQKEVSYMTFETKINDKIKAARKEGLIEGMIALARENLISIDIAAKKSGLSVEEFMRKMNPTSACEDQAEYSAK